jgi:hypothetical protein
MTIYLSKYGLMLSSRNEADELILEISQFLKEDDTVTLDFKGVRTMSTFTAKKIFGELYMNLGSSQFFKRIVFKNTTTVLEAIIKTGIKAKLDDKIVA